MTLPELLGVTQSEFQAYLEYSDPDVLERIRECTLVLDSLR